MYNVKNYTEPGGEKTVIGGTLEIKDGAEVTGLTSTSDAPKLEYPDTYETYLCQLLPADAPLSLVIEVVNDIREAAVLNRIMEGRLQEGFSFRGVFETNDEILKANAKACTISFDSTTNVLTIACDPSELQETNITLYPYNNYAPHKYVVVGFNLGNRLDDDYGDTMLNNTRYYVSAWMDLGLATLGIYIPIMVDMMKPGMNKNIYFMQHGAYERKYISVNLVPKA